MSLTHDCLIGMSLQGRMYVNLTLDYSLASEHSDAFFVKEEESGVLSLRFVLKLETCELITDLFCFC